MRISTWCYFLLKKKKKTVKVLRICPGFKMNRLINELIFLVSIFLCCLVISSNASSSGSNIVFILTDDQDVTLGGMTPMKNVKELLQDHGTTFSNMFASTPICCPSRAGILTGLYQHNHNTINNSISGNCSSPFWQKTAEQKTFSVHAKSFGYHTFFAGKYLNQYGSKEAGGHQHVPPGWDKWYGLVGNSRYYNYTLSDNGRAEQHGGSYTEDYLTDLLANKSVKFIDDHFEYNSNDPFLLMVSTPAPHSPWNAAPQYADKYPNNTAPRGGSFNANGNKKHWLLRQATNPMVEDSIHYLDNAFRKRWQTLLSVDDLVKRIVTTLENKKQLDNTYVIYSSDNGYHLGQFSLPIDKRQLYESDVRVPFIIRGPSVSKNVTRTEPIVSIDIAPTIVDIVGGNKGTFPVTMDGNSIVPLLDIAKKPSWRTDFLVEYQGEGEDYPPPDCPKASAGESQCFPDCVCEDAYNNTYSCVRTLDVKNNVDMMYCEFTDDDTFVEIYNHTVDPYQLDNIKSTINPQVLVKMNQRLITLGACTGKTCRETYFSTDRSSMSKIFWWSLQYLSYLTNQVLLFLSSFR